MALGVEAGRIRAIRAGTPMVSLQLRAAAAASVPHRQDEHFLALTVVHVVQMLCGLLEQPAPDRSFATDTPELAGVGQCGEMTPYNVRELRQLARLLASCSRQACTLADLPERFVRAPKTVEVPVSGDSPADDSTAGRDHRWLSRHAGELARLKATLKQCGGNVSEAARSARIPRHRARRLLAAESRLSAMSPRAELRQGAQNRFAIERLPRMFPVVGGCP